MADFSILIKNKFSVDTFENTKKTYEWIYNSLSEANLVKAKIKSNFLFDVGKITCTCDSFEEFKKNAFGYSDFKLNRMSIFQITLRNDNIHIYVDNSGLRVSSNNKMYVEKLIQILNKDTIANDTTYIENQYIISNIKGNNNNINQGGRNNIIISNDKEKFSKLKQWVESILQNLLANWLGYLLTAIVTLIIGCLIKAFQ